MDEEILLRFCELFYGYGQCNASWAYIGMEECGCRELEEANARINAWHEMNEQPLVPLMDFLHQAGLPLVQNATWDFLTRIRFAAEGIVEPTQEMRQQVLANQFGDINGHSSLLEFMPLPCPLIRSWPWPDWCNVELRKANYVRRLAPVRAERLQEMVNHPENPRVIIFYGRSYHSYWRRIADFYHAGVDQMADIPGLERWAKWGQRDGKLFISTWHQSGIRRKNHDPNLIAGNLGTWIAQHLNG